MPERFLLVDPLDGTREYLAGHRDFTVNIALIEAGCPVAGAICAPALGEVYMAGASAYRAELAAGGMPGAHKPIVTRTATGAGLHAVASRSHLNAATEQWLQQHPIVELQRAGSSLKFCLIARGDADVYPRIAPTMEWDTAAGHAILNAPSIRRCRNFWELMVGGILAYLVTHQGQRLLKFGNCRSAAGLLLILCGIFLLNREPAFPGHWALLPTLGAFLVISAGAEGWINRYLLGNRIAVGVGLISYPLYLWHWPIFVSTKIVNGTLLTPTDRVMAVTVSVALAFLTYRYLERPFRRSSNPRVPQGFAVAMATVAALGLVIAGGALPARLGNERMAAILAAAYDWEYPPVATENHGFGDLRYFKESSSLNSYTLFIGDSNMEQYAPRIDRAIKDHPTGMNGAILVGNQHTCKLIDEIIADGRLCVDAMSKLAGLIAQASSPCGSDCSKLAHLPGYPSQCRKDQKRLARFLHSIAEAKRVYVILNIPDGVELAPTSMFSGSRLRNDHPQAGLEHHFRFRSLRSQIPRRQPNTFCCSRRERSRAHRSRAFPLPRRHCPVFDDAASRSIWIAGHLTRSYAIEAATYIDATLEPEIEPKQP